MSKIMLINVTHAEENRVGIVENGQLESFEIESFSREHLKGNIYKGIVRRIHPAIEAAFVDIGAERDAFLPLDEICFRNLPAGRDGGGGEKGRRRIKDVLKSGDEVLVQIIKEQFTNKPPTLSTFYSLPGRYLVLLPGSDEAGISRKIEGEERLRVREMVGRLTPPPGCGIIVRTAAGFDEEQGELERDMAYLQRLWESIHQHSDTRRAPALIYREHDLVLRNIRDYFTPDINEIFIDNEEVYERAGDFLHNVMPGKEHLLHLYQGEQPIFSRFGVEAQIESIYKRRVQLKSGGSIVIDGTEALTAIDVNSGGSMRGGSQEETAHKTNLEAATEIARQLRLRDLGGIIVVDFIDMRNSSHVSDVERTLREAMRPDKARHDVGRISRLGLLEISRQRLRPAATASSYTACPMCEGHGAIRTTESAALVVLRKIHNRIAEGDIAQMKVSLPRDVAMYLLNQKRDDLAVLETRYAANVTVVVSDKLMPHQSEIEIRTRDVSERALPVVRPGEVAVDVARAADRSSRAARASVEPAAASTRAPARRPATGAEAGAEGEGRARRRRRRSGRGRREESAAAQAPRPLPEIPVPSAEDAPVVEDDLAVVHEIEATPAPVTPLAPEQTSDWGWRPAPATEPTSLIEEAEPTSLTEEPAISFSPESPPPAAAARQPEARWGSDAETPAEPPADAEWRPDVWSEASTERIETVGEAAPVELVEQVPDVPASGSSSPAGRRRRRRGGRRGGRGRKPASMHAEGSPEGAGELREGAEHMAPASEEGAATPRDAAPNRGPEGQAPRRRRGRRGGRGRRMGLTHGTTSAEGPAERPEAAAAAGPGEPSSES